MNKLEIPFAGTSRQEASSKRVLFLSSNLGCQRQLGDLLVDPTCGWTPVFAADPQSGLELLLDNTSTISAAVVDAGCSEVDGTAFLDRARNEVPHVARLLLAASDGGRRVLSSPMAVCTLPRQCERTALEAFLDRALATHVLIRQEPVVSIVGEVDYLPPLPSTYQRFEEAASTDDVNLREIATIVESDPAMALRVLHLVNSAGFGMVQRIPSVFAAVQYLGLELLRGLLLAAHVMHTFEHIRVRHFSLTHFQRYSTRVAGLARCFSASAHREEALIASVLHDIGELILALRRPDEFSRIAAQAMEAGEPTWRFEQAELGASHGEVGAAFLAKWGMPLPVVECVAYHHCPSVAPHGGPDALGPVHAACALTSIATCREPESSLDQAYLHSRGFREALPRWRTITADQARTWSGAKIS